MIRELEDVFGELSEESRRQRRFVRELAAVLLTEPAAALDLVACYEHACMEEARRPPIAFVGGRAPTRSSELALRLLAEKHRLAIAARLAWVRYLRRQLKAISSQKP